MLKPNAHIVELIEVIRQENHLFLVFELLHKNLLDEIRRLRRLEPTDAKRIVYHMLLALKHMHANKIIHRDVKPENLLLSKSGVLKMCDLGSARLIAPDQA